MIFGCKHKWTKQSDVVLKSALEDFLEKTQHFQINNWQLRTSFTSKCHIVVLTCDRCGTVKKLVTYNTN